MRVDSNINLNIGGTLTLAGTIALVPVPPTPTIRVFTTARFGTFTAKGEGNMAYNLPDDKMVQLDISYVDSNNNPASIDGDVVWASSSDAVQLQAVTSQNNTSVLCIPSQVPGTLGSAQISATADADMGSGTTSIVTLFDIQVVSGQAVAGNVTAGDLQDIPADAARAGGPPPGRRP